MAKYAALGEYLRKQLRERVPMTFGDIERVIGAKLPPSARRHRPWWSNNGRNSVMTKVWLDAGFVSEQVDMEGRRLVFRRVGSEEKPAAPRAETKHHPAFGALHGLVRILPGTDLTKPADLDWGEVWADGQ